MTKLRREQIDALSLARFESLLPTLVPEIIRRLQLVDVLASSAATDDSTLKATREDLLLSHRFGVSTLNGLLQFCSYRYTSGERWHEATDVIGILESSTMDERDKLVAIEQVLF